MLRALKWVGVTVVALLVLLALTLWLIDWNLLKKPIAHLVSAKLGRPFAIEGPLTVRMSLTPQVSASGVTLANAPWGAATPLFRAREVAFRVKLLPLFLGRVELPQLTLTRPEVLLEKGPQGQPNWRFGPPPKPGTGTGGGGALPVIDALTVEHGVFRYRDPRNRTDLALDVDSLPTQPGHEARIKLAGKGRFKGEVFAFDGTTGSLLALRSPTHPFPLDLKARVGLTAASAKGSVTDPFHLGGMDMALTLQGPDLAKLHEIVPVPIPSTPPYRFRGRLLHRGATWSFVGFHGLTGRSELAGDFHVDTGKRLRLRGNLHSKLLDMKDLAGFIGGAPKPAPGEKATRAQKIAVAKAEARPTLLPNKPFNLSKLRAVDADVQFRGERIRGTKHPLQNVETHLVLRHGVLHLDPLNFGVADGTIASQVVLDASKDPIDTTADITAKRLRLGKLFPAYAILKKSRGIMGGRGRINARGNSAAALAADATGDLGLIVSSGRVSGLIMKLIGLDLAGALRYYLNDKKVQLRCLVGDFSLNHGIAQPKFFVLDTSTETLLATGDINLRNESMNVRLLTYPKSGSPVSLRSPLTITGTFKKPSVKLDKKRIVERALGAAALGAAAPAAALLALIQTPTPTKTPCGPLERRVRALPH